jgi:hypothetical protein
VRICEYGLISHSQQKKSERPAVLRQDGVYFDRNTIVELAKTSFRGFKTKALAQRDEEKLEKLEANRMTSNRRDRRKTVRTSNNLNCPSPDLPGKRNPHN